MCVSVSKVTVLGLVSLWFRQAREAERASGVSLDAVSLPDKSKLFEALQRLPISFGMAMRVRDETDIHTGGRCGTEFSHSRGKRQRDRETGV